MKREELRKILEYKKILFDYYGDGGLYWGTALRNFEKKDCFPDVEFLKEEFEVLRTEINDVIAKKNEASTFFKNYKCNHEVRVSDYEYYGGRYDDTCVLCDHKLIWNSALIKYNSMDNLNERNKKLALFMGVTPCDNSEYYNVHYTKNDVIEILTKILETSTDEEIDLVDEIEKLRLDHCKINKPHNKNLVMIIVGSNKEYIDDNIYLTSINSIEVKRIIEYFTSLFNVAIEIVGNNEIYDLYKPETDHVMLYAYEKIGTLKTHLAYEKDIPFSLIVNMSNLYTYTVTDNKIIPVKYNLELEKIFPDVPIVNIGDFANCDKEVITDYLRTMNGNTYACNIDKYYYLKDDEVKYGYVNDTFNDIKKLIKTKGNRR